jgi:L-ribulose-5-phosphate 3-epimerase
VNWRCRPQARLPQLADGEGAHVSSFCYPLLDNNPNGVDRLMRAYTLDRYKEAIDFAAELECPYVVAIPGPVNSLINPPHQWMLDWFVEGMKELVAYAKGTGVSCFWKTCPSPTCRRPRIWPRPRR